MPIYDADGQDINPNFDTDDVIYQAMQQRGTQDTIYDVNGNDISHEYKSKQDKPLPTNTNSVDYTVAKKKWRRNKVKVNKNGFFKYKCGYKSVNILNEVKYCTNKPYNTKNWVYV